MDKRLWINLGLLSFIILLAIIISNSDKETEQALPRLSNIDQNDIVRIKVLRRDLDNFEFNKQGETWHLNSPQQFRANIARINAMLRILTTESHSQLNSLDVNLENLGLDKPIVIMRLNDHEFKFGNTDAIDQRRYVLFKGSIHLTNDFLYQQLMTNAAFFAEPKLLPEKFKINTIEFPENKIESINGQWQLQTMMDISPDQLKRIIFSWENVSAISVEKYVPTTSDAIIRISSENNESIQFDIVSTEPHLILGRKDIGVQFHMGSDETKKLLLIENIDINDNTEPATGLELH